MVLLATLHPTLLDVTKRLDPKGKIDLIAEILNQVNEPLDDEVWIEGNLPTGHRTTIRTGLPTPTWRKLYGGVQPTKSTTAQITDSCGMLEAYAEIDKALADLNGNAAAFRMTEDIAHIEGMSQEHMQTLIYGNEGSEPEAFTGLSPRFAAKVSGGVAIANGENILDAGGANGQTDLTSIWLVVWGPRTVHMIYPKGSMGGLQVEDLGRVTIENANDPAGTTGGGRFEAYRSHYRWDCGLCVRDWRYVVRIANIDCGNLTKNAATGADLIDLLAQATELIPNLSAGRAMFMANRTIKSFLKRQIANKIANATLTEERVGGKHVVMWEGIPFRRCDAILGSAGSASGDPFVPVT